VRRLQRAWLFSKLLREALPFAPGFPTTTVAGACWLRRAKGRLEELAFLFLRARARLPRNLSAHANLNPSRRSKEPNRSKSSSRIGALAVSAEAGAPGFATRDVAVNLPATGGPGECVTISSGRAVSSHASSDREKLRSLHDMLELTTRAAHEQELFPRTIGISPMARANARQPEGRR